MKKDREWLIIFSLFSFAAAFAYYGPFLTNFFIFDDFRYIENIFHGFWAVFLGYNTLRLVSNGLWWPLYAIGGFNPFVFNLFAVILYGVNAILLYLLLSKLFNDKNYAFLGGSFFLLNSVGCDAVFWKAAHSGLVSLFFYLLALYSYVIYRQKGAGKQGVLAVVFFIFAMFSKEEAASLPFIIILIDLVFFGGLKDKKGVISRVAPYGAMVLFYLAMNRVVYIYLLHSYIELAKFFDPRPLYALFAGWSVFFLDPQGYLDLSNPLIYITGAGIVLSFFWVKDKKALYFGYGWIFFSFLPQSLTRIGQFDPRYIFDSISRYLYITSVGSSVVFAAVILRFRERFSSKVFFPVAIAAVSLFIWVNCPRVQARGFQWREQAEPVKPFLRAVKKAMPDFPPNSYVFVINGPVGRSYIQQSLRAFYGRADISWIYTPQTFVRKPGESAFLIICNWSDGGVYIKIFPIDKVPPEVFI